MNKFYPTCDYHLLAKELYLNYHTAKEDKKYGDYAYVEYTVPLQRKYGEELYLKIGDYTGDLQLVIGEEPVQMLIGNLHRKLAFDLKNNRFAVE